MIKTIAEHTLDFSLLPKKANILDLGCRGFQFADYFRVLGHNVFAVDCDDLNGSYFKVAISDFNGFTDVYKNRDPQATRITRKHEGQSSTSVLAMTLEKFSLNVEVKFWDLIKMDIEGSEKEVIMAMSKPVATQLSIEFHLHTKVYSEKDVRDMEIKLMSLGYKVVKHEKTAAHGCGLNYWDSLFVLND